MAVTDFLLFNSSVPLVKTDPGSPLVKPITETSGLTLSHRDHVFAFEFAALHFANPNQNRYAYRLEGFDADWVWTDATKRQGSTFCFTLEPTVTTDTIDPPSLVDNTTRTSLDL